MNTQYKHLSKFISLILRHRPEVVGLTLNESGWANVDILIEKLVQHGEQIDRVLLKQLVADNDKQRFIFNEDESMIRANQGHSIDVALGLEPQIPPAMLYHGTGEQFVAQILREGLKKQSRQHVHLSALKDTAMAVGSRKGKAVLLLIDTLAMTAAGHPFYLAANGVWLCDEVPPAFIRRD